MTIKRHSFCASFLLLFLLCAQTSVVIQAKGVDVDVNIKNLKNNLYKETLDNGLTLLFYHKEHTPEVMVKVMYDVGSKDETSLEYGFAHLVEHMIFKGTQKLSEQDIFEISRKFGAELNAYTSYDKTVYYFGTDNKNWTVFLHILADCMENVRIADEHLASELKTVFDELKMRNGDGMGDVFAELLLSNHPYHHPIIGYKENLLTLDPEKVRAFYKKFYRPDRATVMVVGDLEKNDVVHEVKEAFSSISCPPKSLTSKKENTQFAYINKDFFQKNIVVYKSIPNTSVSYVWITPGSYDAKNSACSKIIETYLSTQLNDILHDKEALVSGVGADSFSLLQAGCFFVGFDPQAQKTHIEDVIQTCKDVVIKEVEKVAVGGIPQDELMRVKRVLKVRFLKMFEHCDSIARILENYIINKNECEIFDRLALLDAITNDDIKAFTYHYVRPALMNSFITKPLKDTEKDEWLALQRAVDAYDSSLLALKERNTDLEKPRETHELPKPTLLDVTFEKPDTEFSLSNGLYVMTKQRKDVPFIVSMLHFKNSHIVNRYFAQQGKTVIPLLSSDLLVEGSVGYSKEDHRKFFEDLGASCYGEMFSCVSSDFDAVAQRHVHIITKPTYPEKAFEKEIKNRIQNIEKLSENENFVADNILGRYLGQDDFLTQKTFKEMIDDLSKCEHSDIVAFHEKYMVPHNMVLAIVGDFDEATIKQQLENSYGQWQSSSQACDIEKIAVSFPELKTPKAKEQRVYLPKERVVLTAGRITVKRNDDDYFSLRILEHYIEKKLFALREQYGLFYDCSCNLFAGATYEQQGQAKITVGLSLANVDVVSKLIKMELNSIAQIGISQEDFQNARNTIINDWAKSNNSNRSIASWFVHIKSHGHTWNHEEERFAKQMSVTRDDVSTVAKKYLHSDEWSFVIVGRIKKTGEQEIV